MRIISGSLKGRQLHVPPEAKLRPTTDRVRTSLFDSLEQLTDFSECVAVDLYSGSGSLGFEAISRGVRECFFVEQARVLVRYLNETASALGVFDRAAVLPGEVLKVLPRLAERLSDRQQRIGDFVRLILADPPYTAHPGFNLLRELLRSGVVAAPTVVAIGRPRQLVEPGHETWPGALTPRPTEIKTKSFGDTQFDIYIFT